MAQTYDDKSVAVGRVTAGTDQRDLSLIQHQLRYYGIRGRTSRLRVWQRPDACSILTPMPPLPRLAPAAPTRGDGAVVDRSPFWIGSAASSGLRLHLPGIAERHASITEREDGFYLTPYSGVTTVRVGGHGISAATRLSDADVIEFAPAARYEFVTGANRAKPVAAADPEPVYAPEAPRRARWWKRRRRAGSTGVGFPIWAWLAIALIVAAGAYGASLLVTTIRSAASSPDGPPPLTEAEGRLYDSLMVESTRSLERGATLLDLGLQEEGLRQLADAITVLDASPLARNPWVEPSINTVAKAVRDVYQAHRLNPPAGLRRAGGKLADLSKTLSSNLTAEQFRQAVDRVQDAFEVAHQRRFTITGQDHAEHVSLYGKGSALDIRVRDLSTEQVRFLIDGFGRAGIRVKDFSTDAILQAQIQAARARGWDDRAGTGLHLHIDRFRDRRDRWTVTSGGP